MPDTLHPMDFDTLANKGYLKFSHSESRYSQTTGRYSSFDVYTVVTSLWGSEVLMEGTSQGSYNTLWIPYPKGSSITKAYFRKYYLAL